MTRNEAAMDFQEREALRVRRVTIPMSLPMNLVEVLDRFAAMKGWNGSQAMEYLFREALKAEAQKPEYRKAT